MLIGQKVILRAARPDDLPMLAGLRNDLALQALLMARPKPNSQQRIQAWLEEKNSQPDSVFFVIAAKETNVAAGFLQLVGIDQLNGHAELGLCLASDGRGQGLAAEALLLAENYALDIFHLRKIIARVLAHNAMALAFFDRLGFARVGQFKQHFYYGRQYHDVVLLEKFTGGEQS